MPDGTAYAVDWYFDRKRQNRRMAKNLAAARRRWKQEAAEDPYSVAKEDEVESLYDDRQEWLDRLCEEWEAPVHETEPPTNHLGLADSYLWAAVQHLLEASRQSSRRERLECIHRELCHIRAQLEPL